MSLNVAPTNPISLVGHVYNPSAFYILGPTPYKENGKIAYTYAIPPQKPELNSTQWPYSPQVQLIIRFKDKIYTDVKF